MIDNQTHTEMDFTPFEELPIEEQLMSYISDQYKSAYGFRPDLRNYSEMSESELREELDFLNERVGEQVEREERMAHESVEDFKTRLQSTIELGASDEETALRWMTQEEDFQSSMDTEGYVWSEGMLFTDYGREIVEKLNEIYFK